MNAKGKESRKINICLPFPNWLQNLVLLLFERVFQNFGAVIFFDMVLPGLNSAVTEEETFQRNGV